MEFEGTVQNGVIVMVGPLALPDGTKVRVLAEPLTRKPTLADRLLKHAGTVADLPSDMAEQHDHYIHGTAKR